MTTDAYASQIQEFVSSLGAIAELIKAVEPHLTTFDSPGLPQDLAERIKETLPTDRLPILTDVLSEFAARAILASSEPEGPWFRLAEEMTRLVSSLTHYLGKDSYEALVFVDAMQEEIQRAKGTPFMYRALAVSVDSSFEVLFGGIVRTFYQSRPEAIGDEKQEMALSELKKFASIEEAVERIVDKHVDSLLHKSVDEWSKWSAKNLGADFEALASDWPAFREAVARRNVITHNNGLASHIYVSVMQKVLALENLPEIGELLPVDPKYLAKMMREYYLLGVMVGLRAWIKFLPEEEEAAIKFACNLVYDLLKEEDYEACAYLAAQVLLWEKDWTLQRRYTQCNLWIARKRSGEDSYREEVEKWDVASLSVEFKLAKNCLLDDDLESLRLLDAALQSGEVSRSAAYSWPLLSGIRNLPAFKTLMKEHESGNPPRIVSCAEVGIDEDSTTLSEIAATLNIDEPKLEGWVRIRFGIGDEEEISDLLAPEHRQAIARHFGNRPSTEVE